MPRQSRILIAMPVLAAALLIGSPARAQFDLEPTQDAVLAVDGTISGTLIAISTFLVVQLPMIESAITAAAGSVTQAVNVYTHAHASINDVNMANDYYMRQQDIVGQENNHAQSSIAGCQVASGNAAAGAPSIALARVSTVGGMMAGFLSRGGNAPGENTYYGTFAGLSIDAAKQFPKYGDCNAVSTSAGGGNCQSGPMPGADVNANTLFGADTILGTGSVANPNGQNPVGAPTTYQTVSYQQWDDAAKAYCLELMNPIAPDPLKNSLLGTPQGVATFQGRKAADARMSMSQMVCAEMVADREPNTVNNVTWAQQIQNDLIQNYNLPATQVAVQNFSAYQLTKIQTHDQFADPAWVQMVSSESSTTAVLRDLNHMEASSLQLQWKEYESLERIKLLEAISLSTETEQGRTNAPTTALPSN